MLIVNQDCTKVFNLNRYDGLGVAGNAIVLERESKSYVVGRYESDGRAQQAFEELLEAFAEAGSLPFEESANPFWIPRA